MYKPGTQLIIIDVWAAIVARELRFEIDSGRVHWDKKTEFWNTGFSVSADKWRITVTESGPNAAERFLPQVGDFIFTGECVKVVDDFNGLGVPGFIHPTCAAETLTVKGFRYDTGARRIIERDGIPFPQFSEVIEP
jgi:hypothetical protein